MDSQPKFAIVEKVLGRTGSRGGITQVQVCLLGGNRRLIRNVQGAIREHDTLILMESEREARRIR